MSKTPFEKHIQRLTEITDTDDPRLKQMLKEIGQNSFEEDFVDSKISEMVEYKNKRMEKEEEFEAKNLGASMRAYLYSRKLEKLLKGEAKARGLKDENELFWMIMAAYFDIPIEECDPRYWAKKEGEKNGK